MKKSSKMMFQCCLSIGRLAMTAGRANGWKVNLVYAISATTDRWRRMLLNSETNGTILGTFSLLVSVEFIAVSFTG